MSKLGRLAILALISIPLSGCSATGELFKPAQQVPGMAQVHIYRTLGAAASGVAEHIFLDGKEVVELVPGGYYVTPVTPGEHTIAAKMLVDMFGEKQEIGIRLVAETGEIYYVRVGAALTFFIGPLCQST